MSECDHQINPMLQVCEKCGEKCGAQLQDGGKVRSSFNQKERRHSDLR